MAAQLPRPWFRLGSISRPAAGTTTTTAPVTEQQRPAPVFVRPPIIRPAPQTDPAEPNSPLQSAKPVPAANVKSPPPPLAAALPRPTTSLPSSPTLTPSAKKAASPSTMTLTRPVLQSWSPPNGERGGPGHSSPPQKEAASPASAAVPPAKPSSPPFPGSDSKARASVPASPTHSNTTLAARNSPSPVASPAPVRHSIPAVPSPKQSPKPKAAPPSPLVLPPPQLQSVGDPKHESIPQEVERKTVVVQKIMDKPTQPDHYSSYHARSPSLGQNGKEEPKKPEEQGKDKGIRAKKVFGSDQETNTRVITMAGENRGAFMELVLPDKNNSNSRHHQIGQNSNDTRNEEGNLKSNDPKLGDKNSKKTVGIRNSSSLPMKAFFNSNVQGINNSILMDSSFSHHDPGIHLVFSRTPPSADEVEEGQ